MASLSNKVDVLVVGAGPTGLLAALQLAHSGIEVEVVDRAWRSASQSYACGLHGASLEILSRFGLDGPVLEAGMPVRTLAFYEGAERRAELQFRDPPGTAQGLLVLPQDRLESILEDALRARGVHVRWGHRFDDLRQDDTAVFAAVEKLGVTSVGYPVARSEEMVERDIEVHARYLIGADGAASHVRQMLGIPFKPSSKAASYELVEFEPVTAASVGSEVRLAVASQTLDAFWPQPGSTCRWSLETHGDPADRPAKERHAFIVVNEAADGLERERIERLIRARAPWFEAGVREVDWTTRVQFEHGQAESLGRGRAWLAGDAAHQTSPAGMQSMNVGLREAVDLASRLVGILRHGDSTTRLDEYERQRQAEWAFLLGRTGGLVDRAGTNPWAAHLRRRLLPCLPASGSGLAALAGQLGLEATGLPS